MRESDCVSHAPAPFRAPADLPRGHSAPTAPLRVNVRSEGMSLTTGVSPVASASMSEKLLPSR